MKGTLAKDCERAWPSEHAGETDSKDFPSDSNASETSLEAEKEDKSHALVQTIGETTGEGECIKTELSCKLAHLSRKDAEQITRVLTDRNVNASSSYDPKTAGDPYRHSFSSLIKVHFVIALEGRRQNTMISSSRRLMLC